MGASVVMVAVCWSCACPARFVPLMGADDASPGRMPRLVRVLVSGGVRQLRLRGDARLDVIGAGAGAVRDLKPGEWLACGVDERGAVELGSIGLTSRGVRLRDAEGSAIWLSVQRQGEWLPPRRFGGDLVIQTGDSGGLEVINEVDVETYVACVTAREAAPTFHREAVRAQAVLCRSYVLYQMRNRNDQDFDVVASESSQVYAGLVDGPIGRAALSAAQDTRGLVCTCQRDGRVDLFPTYYSSCCGGATQPAASLNLYDDVEPLRTCVRCPYCAGAPRDVSRWDGVELPESKVLTALAGRDSRFSDWSRIRSVAVSSRTEAGRPLSLTFEDPAGRRVELLAEHLRVALGSRVMRSTDCDITFSNGVLRLQNGRGFGHGLGACQWGMEGQAVAGRSAADILRFYFPGSSLTRVY